MAKQAVGPVGRHLEKGVLALTAAVFLFCVARFGVVSPVKVELSRGEGQVGPADVDQAVKEAADTLAQRLLNSEVEPPDVADPLPHLRALGDPLRYAKLPDRLPRAVAFAPPVPDIGAGPAGAESRIKLADVVKLDEPQVDAGRSGVLLAEPIPFDEGSRAGQSGKEFDIADVNWATVSALFDRQAQEALCRQAGYGVARWETVFLGVELERRMQMADGSFTEWARVSPVADRLPPDYPGVAVYEVDGKSNVSEEQRDAIKVFYEMIEKPINQLELIRPLFPDIEYGDPWLYPRTDGYDVLDMDEDYGERDCRYPECAGKVEPKAQTRDELMEAAEDALERGDFDFAEDLVDQAARKDPENMPSRDKRRIEQIRDDIKEARAEAGKAEAQPAGTSPVQLFWAHDAQPGSLFGGRTYQYRMRALIYNRHCGVPTLLLEPRDAQVVALAGPWSEPSASVTIPVDTAFFVKSARKQKRELKVEVFKWVEGIWVKRTFAVAKGEPIGGRGTVKTPSEPRGTQINFDTGATVIDIDFARPYRAPKGSKLGAMDETTALIYVDAAGQLRERFLDIDKASQEYKRIKSAVWKPPRNP